MQQIHVTQSSMPEFEEFCNEIKPLWESKRLTNCGELHERLQNSLCSYLGVPNTALFVNGHTALEAAIAAHHLTGEVITTPFTFASTTQAIVRNGLTPVFCDINDTDFTIDTEKIEALITPKTSAIIPVHVYGNVCNVYEIERIAQKHHLNVIYDAAHAFGEKINGVGVGNFGDASMFSFHATKVFHTIEGGCITFADKNMAKTYQELRNFGMENQEEVVKIAGNGKMNEFQAAMGLCNLRRIQKEIENRKSAVKRYQRNLKDIPSLRIWQEQPGVAHNYAYMPVIFPEGLRDAIFDGLAKSGIFARKYFYPLTSSYACYKGMFAIQDTPVAQKIAGNVLSLPLYAALSPDDVDRICEHILHML